MPSWTQSASVRKTYALDHPASHLQPAASRMWISWCLRHFTGRPELPKVPLTLSGDSPGSRGSTLSFEHALVNGPLRISRQHAAPRDRPSCRGHDDLALSHLGQHERGCVPLGPTFDRPKPDTAADETYHALPGVPRTTSPP